MPTSDAESRTRDIVDRLARTLRSAMDHGVACKYCEGWLTRGGQVCGAGSELWAIVANVLKAYEDAVKAVRRSTSRGGETDEGLRAHADRQGWEQPVRRVLTRQREAQIQDVRPAQARRPVPDPRRRESPGWVLR
jgi:hypothetical protein